VDALNDHVDAAQRQETYALCHRHVSPGGMLVHMADSDAVRSRRKRLHALGDHSTCKHFPEPRRPVTVLDAGDGAELDPVLEMRLLACRLVDAYRENPGNAALAREARATLLALAGMGPASDEPDLLAEILSQPNSHWPDLYRSTIDPAIMGASIERLLCGPGPGLSPPGPGPAGMETW
jgi:hypothetical protein